MNTEDTVCTPSNPISKASLDHEAQVTNAIHNCKTCRKTYSICLETLQRRNLFLASSLAYVSLLWPYEVAVCITTSGMRTY